MPLPEKVMRQFLSAFTILCVLFLTACGHDPTQVQVVDMGLSGVSVGTATVRPDDTLSEIAERYDLSMRSIIAANNLKPPYVIYPNQRLRLPPPRTYAVRHGDTIYEISRMFNTTQTALVRLNNIQRPYTIITGEVLKMPMPEQSFEVAHSAPIEEKPAVKALKKRAKIAAPKLSGSGKFAMPVNGRIISAYGPKGGGLHNDGINIAAPRGASVRSAQSGVVAYVGDAIEGYGNLVLVRHDKGYITAYAHLGKVTVTRGDMLGKGQVLGSVGMTGSVTEPQLHFEIRKGTKALNPELLL